MSPPSSAARPGSLPYFNRWMASRSGPSWAPVATSVTGPRRRAIGSDESRQVTQYQAPPAPQPAQRGGTSTSRTPAKALPAIVEAQVVAGLRAARGDRAGAKLDDVGRAASGDDRYPRTEIPDRAHDPAGTVHEQRIDREPHEEHRDAARLRDAERFALGEGAVEQEPDPSAEEGVGGAAVGGEDRAPRAIAEPRGPRSYRRSSSPTVPPAPG